ncbi:MULTISPECIES: dihydrofolate reductase family protein [unclassified Streptomyces]|uniref:dihydrofolate reductase family protein n=1 Tax=unclassified Streptomyces TaxID=2593676 RepID=UPI00093C3542|nr:dihydrofolate reductase family protein [Streptomyces sp. TSRI0281]OKI34694.1 deaminase [Streptomyces sp. TSRI0281]
MNKIVLMMSVSLDGFFEGPERDIAWHLVDEELHQHFNDELRTVGAFLDGRVSYELMAGFWPTADADPESSPQMAEFAGIWRDMPKYVYSRTLKRADWGTTVVREIDAAQIEDLRARADGDLALGGANLAAGFRRLGLIDEYRIYVHPVLLGRGRPLFAPSDTREDLRLAGTRTFGNGVVQLRYETVRA